MFHTVPCQACCEAGSPQAAVNALGEAGKYGLDEEHVVGPNRFNFLLGHLYKAGDEECAFPRKDSLRHIHGQLSSSRLRESLKRVHSGVLNDVDAHALITQFDCDSHLIQYALRR